jgi:hypothetical protein
VSEAERKAFKKADQINAGMHGYEPVERPPCDGCGEPIVGPAMIRAGKTKPAWFCGKCKEKG